MVGQRTLLIPLAVNISYLYQLELRLCDDLSEVRYQTFIQLANKH